MFGQAFFGSRRPSGVFASSSLTAIIVSFACIAVFAAIAPRHASAEETKTPQKALLISGKVQYADGKPAKNINILAAGRKAPNLSFDERIRTDAEGRYEFIAQPDAVYMLVADEEKWASTAREGVIVREGQSVENVNLVLHPASRIVGRWINPTNEKPMADKNVVLHQLGSDLSSNAGISRLLTPNGEAIPNFAITRLTKSDKDGRYEFHVGPGDYRLSGQDLNSDQQLRFTVGTQTELTTNMSFGLLKTLSLRVVNKDGTATGVAGATVFTGDSEGDKKVLGAGGQLSCERETRPLAILARSADSKWIGLVHVASDQKEATIELQKPVTVKGRLLNAKKGSPIVNQRVNYFVRVYNDDAKKMASRRLFGGYVLTDADGRFETPNLSPGVQYEFSLPLFDAEDPRAESDRSDILTRPTLTSEPVNDLGDIKYDADPKYPLVRPGAKPDLVEVAGSVVDEKGVPASGVNVKMFQYAGALATRTDSAGKFRFMADWKYASLMPILAFTDDRSLQAAREPGEYETKIGQTPEEVKLQLKPARKAFVRTIDAKGLPVAGATVGMTGRCLPFLFDAWKTDEKGEATLLIPQSAPIKALFALKSKAGLDYYSFESTLRTDDPDFSKPFVLTLNGAKSAILQLLHPKEDTIVGPIVGLGVNVWTFEKPGWNQFLNLGDHPLAFSTTDKEGYATFDWFPSDNIRQHNVLRVMHENTSWGVEYISIHNNFNGSGPLKKKVLLSGKVLRPDGKPAAGVPLRISGKGGSAISVFDVIRTDLEGRYEFLATPDMLYAVMIRDDKWSAPAQQGIVVRNGQSVTVPDVTLRPAARVIGQLTRKADGKPLPNQLVSLYQRMHDVRTREESRTLFSQFGSIVPIFFLDSVKTDKDGRYEFRMGPGKYLLRTLEGFSDVQLDFSVDQETELTENISVEPTQFINVHIVAADANGEKKPVVGAKVVAEENGDEVRLSDVEGNATFGNLKRPTSFLARSPDGTRLGVGRVEVNNNEVTIELKPASSIKGQLLGEESGKPLAGQLVTCSVFTSLSSSNLKHAFGQAMRTDKDGRFEFADLSPDAVYDVAVVWPADVNGGSILERLVMRPGTTHDLGEVKNAAIERMANNRPGAMPMSMPAPTPPQKSYPSATPHPDSSFVKPGYINPGGWEVQTPGSKPRLDWVEISGKVVDEAQLPIPNARVRTAISGFQKQAETICDKKGEFSFQIPFGPWDGEHSGNLIVWTKDRQLQTMHYLPQVQRKDDAKKSRFIPKQTITLRPARPIGVKIVDAAGKPIAEATTAAMGTYIYFDSVRTNALGKATLLVPANASVKRAIAFKSGAGFDMVDVSEKVNPYADDAAADGEVTLTLRGAKTATVKVVDEKNRPVSGVEIVPTAFRGEGVPKVNVGLCPASHRLSNDEGEATFDWFPKEAVGGQYRIEDDSDVTLLRATPGGSASGVDQTYIVQRPTTIAGHVKKEDGSPAADVWVIVSGTDAPGQSIGQRTDSAGAYTIRVNATTPHFVTVDDGSPGNKQEEKLAAAGVTVTPILGKTVQADFDLAPATLLQGRVTIGPDKKPLADRPVYLVEFDPSTKIEDVRREEKPARYQRVRTDADGKYQFRVGPGAYDVYPVLNVVRQSKSVKVTDQKTVEANFEIPLDEHVATTGRVIEEGDEKKTVSDATISCVSAYIPATAPPNASLRSYFQTNAQGEFSIVRPADFTVLQAAKRYWDMTGVVVIDSKIEKITISVQKMGTIKGRLVAGADKLPIRVSKLYGMAAPNDPVFHREFLFFTSNSAKPGGAFKTSIPSGIPFKLYFTVVDKSGRERKWIPLPLSPGETDKTVATLKPGENRDLGEVALTDEQLAIDDGDDSDEAKKENEKYTPLIPASRFDPALTVPGGSVNGKSPGAVEPGIKTAATAAVPSARDAGSTPEDEKVLVRGDLVDPSGRPAAGATVRGVCTDYGQRPQTTCDDNGHFELVLPGGNWTDGSHGGIIMASADKTAQSYLQLPKTKRTSADGKLTGLDGVAYDLFVPLDSPLALKPAKEVRVRVIDSRGNPIEGAITVVSGTYFFYYSQKTDAEGRATLLGPPNGSIRRVSAFKSGEGCAFVDLPSGQIPTETALTLAGARTVTLNVVDRQNKPVKGVPIMPRVVDSQPNLSNMGLAHCPEAIGVSDENGKIVFDWLPAAGDVKFYLSEEEWITKWIRPTADVKTLQVRVTKAATVAGMMRFSDGTPAANVSFEVNDDGYSINDIMNLSVTSRHDGRYSVKFPVGHPRVLSFIGGQNVKESSPDITLTPRGDKLNVLDITLKKGTRLQGRVTYGPENIPFANRNIDILRYSQKPTKEAMENALVTLTRYHYDAKTNQNGEYEIYLSPGYYEIEPVYSLPLKAEELTVEKQESIRKDIHLPRYDRAFLAGKVIIGDDESKPAPGIEVICYPQWWLPNDQTSRADYNRVVSDAKGEFRFERILQEAPLVARDPKNNTAALVLLKSEQEKAILSLKPTVSLKGRLMQGNGKAPVAKATIQICAQVQTDNSLNDYPYASCETDEQGRFTISGLPMPGKQSLKRIVRSSPNGISTQPVAINSKPDAKDLFVFSMEEGKPLDLGDVWAVDSDFTRRMRETQNAKPDGKPTSDVFERIGHLLTGGLLQPQVQP